MLRKILNVTLSVSKTGVRSRPACITHLATCASDMSSTSGQRIEVLHDEGAQEFIIPLISPDGATTYKAVLEYAEIKPGFVDLVHTGVPVEFRGHGIAKVLAQAAFDHFVEKKIDMQPSCTYLQKFYKENPLPQYKERVKWATSL